MVALRDPQGFARTPPPASMMQSPALPVLRGQWWKEGARTAPRILPSQAGDNCLLPPLHVKADGYGHDEGKTPQRDPEGSLEVGPSNRVHTQRTFRMGSHCHSVRRSQEARLVGESPGITSFETGRLRRLLTPFPSPDEASCAPSPRGKPRAMRKGSSFNLGQPSLGRQLARD